MNNRGQKRFKAFVSLALAVLMLAGLPLDVFGATPSKTQNTASGVTITQEAEWTNPGTEDGKASVQLTFDGYDSIQQTGYKYDYALIFDGSRSPDQQASKQSSIQFVNEVLDNDPNAHISIIDGGLVVQTKVDHSSDKTALTKGINSLSWSKQDTDAVQANCDTAYHQHTDHCNNTGCDRKLMFVIVGDGDFVYLAKNMFNTSFTVNYYGDTYDVQVTGANSNIHVPTGIPSPTVLQATFYGVQHFHSYEFYNKTTNNYKIYKNGTELIIPGQAAHQVSNYTWCPPKTMTAAFAQVLFLHYLRDTQWIDAHFATICTSNWWAIRDQKDYTYEGAIYNHPTRIKARWAADEGYNFEVKGKGTAVDYTNAMQGLVQKLYTRVVTMETVIDGRYFEVDQAALDAEMLTLGSKCTYTITNVTGGQKVTFTYSATAAQDLTEGVRIPVTLKSGIPAADIAANGGYLPVVLDNTGGTAYIDINGVAQDIRTAAVYLKVSKDLAYVVEYYQGDDTQPSNLIATETMPLVPSGTVITLTQAQLDAYRPSGYQSGVQVGGPVAITTNNQVIKVVYAKGADFSFKKIDGNAYADSGYTQINGLSGAEFSVYKLNALGESLNKEKDWIPTNVTHGTDQSQYWEPYAINGTSHKITSDNNGDISMTLENGFYMLVETKAPGTLLKQYILPTGQWGITIDVADPNPITISEVKDPNGQSPPGFTSDYKYLPNIIQHNLPLTGGLGIAIFTISGTLILAIVLVLFIVNNRRLPFSKFLPFAKAKV